MGGLVEVIVLYLSHIFFFDIIWSYPPLSLWYFERQVGQDKNPQKGAWTTQLEIISHTVNIFY